MSLLLSSGRQTRVITRVVASYVQLHDKQQDEERGGGLKCVCVCVTDMAVKTKTQRGKKSRRETESLLCRWQI